MALSGHQKGLLFAIAAPFFYALKAIAIKMAPSSQVETLTFFRFFFDFLILAPFFIHYRKEINWTQWPLHFRRAIFVVFSIAASVYGTKHLALVDAILLENTLPLFIPIVYWVWYRKKISRRATLILLMGFFSLFFLLKPTFNLAYFASFASLSVGLFAAITAISAYELAKTQHPIAILFYFNLFSGLISLIPFAYSGAPMPSAALFGYLLPISLFGVAFQFSITKAYGLVLPHYVGSFAYSSVLYSAVFGWLIWGEVMDAIQICGAVLLIFSCISMVRQNVLLKQET